MSPFHVFFGTCLQNDTFKIMYIFEIIYVAVNVQGFKK